MGRQMQISAVPALTRDERERFSGKHVVNVTTKLTPGQAETVLEKANERKMAYSEFVREVLVRTLNGDFKRQPGPVPEHAFVTKVLLLFQKLAEMGSDDVMKAMRAIGTTIDEMVGLQADYKESRGGSE